MKAYGETVTGARPQQRVIAAGDLLTIRQALAILPVGRSTLYGLVARGALPSYRVGAAGGGRGRILVSTRDLAAFVAKSRQTAPVAPARIGVENELTETRRRPRNRTPMQ